MEKTALWNRVFFGFFALNTVERSFRPHYSRLREHRMDRQKFEPGCFFFQAEDGIRDKLVTGVQTCALPISSACRRAPTGRCSRNRKPPNMRLKLAGATKYGR